MNRCAENIIARADFMYNIKWTARKNIKGWRNKNTFLKGKKYHIPYGRPKKAGKYICYGVTTEDFLKAADDEESIFYSKRSSDNKEFPENGKVSVYYASDCSSFVSYCWGLEKRVTTALWSGLEVSDLGKCTRENIGNIRLGDALNLAKSHIVLVSGISDGNFEITEQTPPEMKRTLYNASELIERFKDYTIFRYKKRETVPPP